jgi:PleD family two-component response regulator
MHSSASTISSALFSNFDGIRQSSPQSMDSHGLEGAEILIVDDVKSNRKVLGQVLSKLENITLSYAENGKIAVDLVAEDPLRYI